MINLGEALIIGGAVVLLFGASQIPKIAKSLGQGIREFKKALKEEPEDAEKTAAPKAADQTGPDRKPSTPPPPPAS